MPNKQVHIDIETFSTLDLRAVGAYRYFEASTTEILVLCFAFDDEPVSIWIPHDWFPKELQLRLAQHQNKCRGKLFVQNKCPRRLATHIRKGGVCVAHNAEFERIGLNAQAGKNLHIPKTKIQQWRCTAAKAAAAGLPRALKDACSVISTKHQKDENGRTHMLALSKPRQKTGTPKWTVFDEPNRFFSLYVYCANDVYAERDLDKVLPDLSSRELKVYHLDQEINQRGVNLDIYSTRCVQVLRDEYKDNLENEAVRMIGIKPTQTTKYADWLRDNGLPGLNSLQAGDVKDTIEELKGKKKFKKHLKLLRIRSSHAMKAPSKVEAMLRSVCGDGRLRGMFLYHGASPGRWASRLVQLQNMYRSKIKDPNLALQLCAERDMELLKMLYGDYDLMVVFASVMRGLLTAGKGRELMCVDFSAIEGRLQAWLAGSKKLLKIYETHGMVYEYTAAQIYRLPYETEEQLKRISKDQRFIGKISTLTLGYSGASAAFMKMSKQFGVEIAFELADQVKDDWRDENKEIVRLWYALENAFKAALATPGGVFQVANKKIMFCHDGDWMKIRLPSGRKIFYFKPTIRDNQCTYLGINTFTRQWMRVDTWGGKLLQNCLGGQTEILTDSGWKQLIEYTQSDRLWDGLEWVHGGKLICQGMKDIIEYAGVQLTGDHLVLTEQGWKAASQCRRFDWKKVRLPDNYRFLTYRRKAVTLESTMRLREKINCAWQRSNQKKSTTFTKIMRLQNQRINWIEKYFARYVYSSSIPCVGFNAETLQFTNASELSQLRWTRNSSLQTMVNIFRKVLERYGANISSWVNTRQEKQRWKLQQEQLSLGVLSSSSKQSTRQCVHKNFLGQNDNFSSSQKSRHASRYPALASETQLVEKRSFHKSRSSKQRSVYDILNVGQRNRFTVRGNTGDIFIVHNCCEGIARDLMVNGMLNISQKKYPIIGTVHDELITEPKKGKGDLDELQKLFCDKPKWAVGLPVSSSGFIAKRYKKD